METDTTKLSHNQLGWLRLLVKGYGFDASKKQFNGKNLKEMERLIELGLVKRSKNFRGDTVGMFCIVDEKKEVVRKLINEAKND